jgi:DNA polymerase-3 subunit delta
MMKNTVSGLQTFHEAVKQIRAGKLHPVYVLAGEEVYFTDRVQDELLAHIPPDMRDFNLDIFYGTETDVNRVLEAARSFPMMAERRMVIVREFTAMFPSLGSFGAEEEDDKDKDKKDDKEIPKEASGSESVARLIAYLQNPNPQTILILRDAKTPAGNTSFGKVLQKQATSVFLRFTTVPESELSDWIEEFAKLTYGMSMEPEASRLMAQRMGPHLQLLSSELDKLCTQNRTGERITAAQIREKIPVSREFSVFELKEAVLSRDVDRAFYIAERLLHQGVSDVGETFKTISFFFNLFSNLWVYQRLSAKGHTPDEINGVLGMQSGGFYYLQKDAKLYKPRSWAEVFEALHDADRAVKGYSKLEADVIFMMMLKRIMSA